MKGILLTGGLGTRLLPLTKVTNKHLIRVYNKPMVDYSLSILLNAGIKDIMIVLGGNGIGDVANYLGDGSQYDAFFNYAVQARPGGIGEALGLTESFIGDEKFMVVLGDNVIGGGLPDISDFETSPDEARIFLKNTERPQEFGIAEFNSNGKIANIIEKPKDGRIIGHAVVGIYLYSPIAFECIKTLKPSNRGEIEITDLNNFFISRGTLGWHGLKCWWHDCGDIDALVQTEELLKN